MEEREREREKKKRERDGFSANKRATPSHGHDDEEGEKRGGGRRSSKDEAKENKAKFSLQPCPSNVQYPISIVRCPLSMAFLCSLVFLVVPVVLFSFSYCLSMGHAH